MEVVKEELKNFMSNSSANSTDFIKFIKSILAISDAITDETSFATFSQDLKNWIAVFKVIFSETKIDKPLQKYINKYSKVVTKLYFKLLQLFHHYELTYIHEFYYRWKEIVSSMSSYALANSFIRYIGQFKLIINDLENAGHRFEQMIIMKLLRLYTHNVTYDVLKGTGDDNHIIEKIIEMGNEASLRKQHDFLDHINVEGNSIVTAKPTSVIIIQQSFTFSTSEFDMWIDFNVKDESVVFVAVSLTNEEDQCMGIVPSPLVKENTFMGNYVMTIDGYWSLLQKNEEVPGGVKIKIMFISPIYVQDMISVSKSSFKFLPYDYADSNFKDANQNLNKVKESYDSDTTVCLPSVCYSSCNDIEEESCEKSRIFGGAITEMPYYDKFDSDEEVDEQIDDWTYIIQSNKDSQELTYTSSADHMNRGDNWASINYQGDLDNNYEFIPDASFNEIQSENDEQFVNLQMPSNTSEEVLEANSVSQPQLLEEVDPCQPPTAQSLHQANMQEYNVFQPEPQPVEVSSCPPLNAQSLHQANMQESIVSQSQPHLSDMSEDVLQENNARPQSTVPTLHLNRKRVLSLSTGKVTTSTYKGNNGDMSIEIRSHTFSIVEETVNDVIKKNKRTADSSKLYYSNNTSDSTNDYRTRLRPRNSTERDAKRNINKTCTVRTTMRKRRKIRPTKAFPTAATVEAVNVDPVHVMENDDRPSDRQNPSENQLERSLKEMTKCRDEISQIHGDVIRYLDQYIERLQSLLNPRHFC